MWLYPCATTLFLNISTVLGQNLRSSRQICLLKYGSEYPLASKVNLNVKFKSNKLEKFKIRITHEP